MNAPAIYGRERVVLELREPRDALAAAELLHALGDRDVRIDVLSARDDYEADR